MVEQVETRVEGMMKSRCRNTQSVTLVFLVRGEGGVGQVVGGGEEDTPDIWTARSPP